MTPFLSLIFLVTCTIITSSAVSTRQEQTLALEQRREVLKQRLQQLEQSNYNDILANRVAAYHLDQQRRLLRAKLKLKRGLQGSTNVYPGVIKHFGVHPMGFRYFVGYQRPLSSRYLPPTGSVNKPPYNYYPESRPARPVSHYGPPQPPVEVHPIDTPSNPPPQPPEPETPRPIVNTVQFPAKRPDVVIETDGSGLNPTTTVQVRPIQPVPPRPPVVQPQPAPPPTVIVQQRPNPSPPIHLQPIPNAFPVQPIPQTPVFHLQPFPNAVPAQPQPPIHLHPVPNAFPVQSLPQYPYPLQPASNTVPLYPNPQQIPIHFHPNAFPIQPIPQTPVHLQPVPNAFPAQPIPQTPIHLHPQFLRPAYPLPPQPAVVPQQTPVLRVPSITLNPVNPILRPVLQTNIPVGTTLTVAPAGPNLISKDGLVPVPLPPPQGFKIIPGNAVETSYSATFPKVPFIQNIPNGLLPLPTGSHGPILPNNQPIPVIPNHGHFIPNGVVPLQPNSIPFVPNGHLPASIHPPNISLEPPFIKRIDKN